ncbi:DUF6359 domain-containing protein [Prevotella ihumii]|uniref:DUF6359 domain-containing protein n=1 Tax=Prevotella ihumii TaxID=1917878 RepID=UPI0009817B4B|nr:DUF6359 domain-containing protein [Prevotella ihumii]
MKHLISLLFLLFLTVLFGCEKDLVNETSNSESDNIETESEEVELYSDTAISVQQFKNQDFGDKYVWVAGYIVGSCSKSIDNAIWEPPFEYDTAILLADEPEETDPEQVIAIKLQDETLKDQFSLMRNPEIYGAKVCFCGKQQKYLGIIGMKNSIIGYGWLN